MKKAPSYDGFGNRIQEASRPMQDSRSSSDPGENGKTGSRDPKSIRNGIRAVRLDYSLFHELNASLRIEISLMSEL